MQHDDNSLWNLHHDLIEGCRARDQKAQFQVYNLYSKAMFNTSLRIVNDLMEAEDVIQESFLSAFENIDTFSGNVSFGAWLKKIVVNRSIDVLVKRKVVFEDIDCHHDIYDDSSDDFEFKQDFEIKLDEVKNSISKLPDGYRVILSLHLLEGYDHLKIAGLLKISSSTSRSQLSRAKQRLISDLKSNSMFEA